MILRISHPEIPLQIEGQRCALKRGERLSQKQRSLRHALDSVSLIELVLVDAALPDHQVDLQ